MVGALRTLLLVLATAFSPAASPAPSLPSPGAGPPASDEIADQKGIIDAVRAAIDRRDYAALNRMETEFRTTRARTVSGIWKLSVFHWRVKTELGPKQSEAGCDDRSTEFFRGWLAATPGHPAVVISRAAVLEDYAWCIRGSGYAQSVGEEASAAFQAKVEEARAILAKHRNSASIDPHYYAVMARIAIDQGADKADFKALLDEASGREPDYHYLYFDAYRYFQPQWYGSDAEVEALARYAAERTAVTEGLGVYARFYWFALDCDCGIEPSVDWQTMKQAMRDVMDRYPSDWNAANFARIACVMEDVPEATSWFAKVKGDHSVAWSDMNELRRCESMARPIEYSPDRCPYAAREAWPAEAVEKYCR